MLHFIVLLFFSFSQVHGGAPTTLFAGARYPYGLGSTDILKLTGYGSVSNGAPALPVGARVDLSSFRTDYELGWKATEITPNSGTWTISNGIYWSVLQNYDSNKVVIVDCPPDLLFPFWIENPPTGGVVAQFIRENNWVPTHIVYTHRHNDHIGGCASVKQNLTDLNANIEIVSSLTVKNFLDGIVDKTAEVTRPAPTITFAAGSSNNLIIPGVFADVWADHQHPHSDGDLIVKFNSAKTIVAIDLVYPGWVPWNGMGYTQNIVAYYRATSLLLERTLEDGSNWETLVGGHVHRVGTRDDALAWQVWVNRTIEEMADGLRTTAELDFFPLFYSYGSAVQWDLGKIDWWALYKRFFDIATMRCVDSLQNKYAYGDLLGGFYSFQYSHCYTARGFVETDVNYYDVPGSAKRSTEKGFDYSWRSPAAFEHFRRLAEKGGAKFNLKIIKGKK